MAWARAPDAPPPPHTHRQTPIQNITRVIPLLSTHSMEDRAKKNDTCLVDLDSLCPARTPWTPHSSATASHLCWTDTFNCPDSSTCASGSTPRSREWIHFWFSCDRVHHEDRRKHLTEHLCALWLTIRLSAVRGDHADQHAGKPEVNHPESPLVCGFTFL